MLVSLIIVIMSWIPALNRDADHRFAVSQLSTPAVSTTRPSLSTPKPKPQPLSLASFASTAARARDTMASQGREKNLSVLEQHLTPALFQRLREFWFEHLEHEDDFFIPKQGHASRWFMGGKELDDICVERFAPALEAIRESGATTGEDILSVVQPREPLDWLSVILLLDQIPRNCYRGTESHIVFNFFDPMAQQVALAAMEQGIPAQAPETRWHFAYRNWFYIPLMHSESAAGHEKCVDGFALIAEDVEGLAEGPGAPDADPLERRAREVVQRDAEAARGMAATYVGFEKKHQVIIERFGRYPHRNKALGREPTAAETEYLENGGETFGG
ncbi:hypothetical protein AK830_g2853 [Neonectria ditissima]|uniref:DUF924-domain-containing protein n=1 Tax=Neonectria ditissima TaxID=78410 RepID=A0A0P7BSK9_9HYPO|nr:hypothetical protein AK830_g2853 [Neonectria ditissima]